MTFWAADMGQLVERLPEALVWPPELCKLCKLAMVWVPACNPSTQEAGAGGLQSPMYTMSPTLTPNK